MNKKDGKSSVTVIALSLMLCLAGAICFGLVGISFIGHARAKATFAEAEAKAQRAESALVQTKKHIADLEQLVGIQSFQHHVMKHVIGFEPLTQNELIVVLPSVTDDKAMAPIIEMFERDMAAVNQLVPEEKPVSTYHEAVVALTASLKRR